VNARTAGAAPRLPEAFPLEKQANISGQFEVRLVCFRANRTIPSRRIALERLVQTAELHERERLTADRRDIRVPPLEPRERTFGTVELPRGHIRIPEVVPGDP
jgi:hypothetical protein